MALVFNIFLGLTLSITQTSKSINFEYESVKPASYGFDMTLNLNENYYMQFDMKRLGAGVQSRSGHLNVFGWDYTHDIMMLKFGYALDEKQSIYVTPTIHYTPVLFPTQVGALTSIAAFEKTLTYGAGFGYRKHEKIKMFDVLFDVSFSYLKYASEDYDSKYSFMFDVDVHPTYQINESMAAGLNYNLVFGQSSLVENKTGNEFPFNSRYFLHNFFLTFAYTLN